MPITPQSPEDGPRNGILPGAWDDPAAWGYCRYCAFEVAVDLVTDLMVFHEPLYSGSVRKTCPGSFREPTEQPGPTAEPIKLVRLTKSIQQIGIRRLKYEEKYRERNAEYRDGVTRPRPEPVVISPNAYGFFGPLMRRDVEPGVEDDGYGYHTD